MAELPAAVTSMGQGRRLESVSQVAEGNNEIYSRYCNRMNQLEGERRSGESDESTVAGEQQTVGTSVRRAQST